MKTFTRIKLIQVSEKISEAAAKNRIVEVKYYHETNELDLYCRDIERNGYLVKVASIPAPIGAKNTNSDKLLEYGRNNIPEGTVLY